MALLVMGAAQQSLKLFGRWSAVATTGPECLPTGSCWCAASRLESSASSGEAFGICVCSRLPPCKSRQNSLVHFEWCISRCVLTPALGWAPLFQVQALLQLFGQCGPLHWGQGIWLSLLGAGWGSQPCCQGCLSPGALQPSVTSALECPRMAPEGLLEAVLA